MPAGNPLGYLPPEIQLQLLGRVSGPGRGMAPFGQPPPLPAVTSPQYATMVKQGLAPVPQIGTMDYLDFAAKYPGLLGNRRMAERQRSDGASSSNPFEIAAQALGK